MDIGFATEFLERGPRHSIKLISIGLAAEDGREYYAINSELPQTKVWNHYWLHTNVMPQLPIMNDSRSWRWLDFTDPCVRDPMTIAVEIAAFLAETPDPVLITDHGGYDMVMLGQLYGTMMSKPQHIPMKGWDIQQGMDDLGRPSVPPQLTEEHHALHDAKWNLEVKKYLDEYRRQFYTAQAVS